MPRRPDHHHRHGSCGRKAGSLGERLVGKPELSICKATPLRGTLTQRKTKPVRDFSVLKKDPKKLLDFLTKPFQPARRPMRQKSFFFFFFRKRRNLRPPHTAALPLLTLTGCAFRSAPSFPLVGAYFPAWMLCALVGVAVAMGLRVVFLLVGIDALLSFRLFTYVALGTLAALALWALAFGP